MQFFCSICYNTCMKWSKGIIVTIIGIIFFIGLGAHFFPARTNNIVACTMEAKICPDGSSVGRSGPNCTFAPCPNVQTPPTQTASLGHVIGTITLSSTCPTESTSSDSACAPKPYSAFVEISGVDNIFLELHADSMGVYRLQLPVGKYTILIHQNTLYPRCDTQTIVVTAHATTTANIACDSM
jgi:hypothetical protein